ncbi:B-cell receptor CD22 [Anabarilius grahami]|uniref:B-cell receptor CD22 n=1 Tax=Anabarilius grahami TaxID=495550 RepID=A0A3N0YKP5_ANAGA|nr:B-cell receptor CD22 [Anabarilius grahami]
MPSSNITCRGERKSDGQMSEISDAVTRNVSFLTEAPKPVLTLQPEPSQIFRGETVTLTCDKQGEGWAYRLQCGDTAHTSEEKEFKMTVQLRQICRCQGCRGSHCSEWSDAVTLTVFERPKAVVRVQPDGRVFRGQTVTLTCDIQETDVTSWNYTWNKDDSLIHESQSQEYRISSVNESHTGNYSCRGRETDGSRYSHTSDEVTLMLSDKCELPACAASKNHIVYMRKALIVCAPSAK